MSQLTPHGTLLDTMAEPFTMLNRAIVPDGLGGFVEAYTDGVTFPAVLIKSNTMEAKIAEKQGVTEVYKIVVQKGFPIHFHDVVRRGKDGVTYRVTSNIEEDEAPNASTIAIGKVSAERWSLPDA